MDRMDSRLRELNQELIETRNLTIKTDNAVRNLTSEVRELSKLQESFQRRTVWSSATAYILFVVLTFTGLFLFFRAATSRTSADEELVASQQQSYEARVRELQQELERRREAERQAWSFYELLETGEPEAVVERFPEVQARLIDRATVELYRREVDRIRQELASDAFSEGMRAFSEERWQQARDAFLRSSGYREFAPYTPELNYHLAEALFQLDDHATATRYYNLALSSDELSGRNQATATYHLAESLRAIGRDREALEAYRNFSRNFSGHPWRSAADARASMLENRLSD